MADAGVLHPETPALVCTLETDGACRQQLIGPIISALRAAIHAWRGSPHGIPVIAFIASITPVPGIALIAGITSTRGIKTSV